MQKAPSMHKMRCHQSMKKQQSSDVQSNKSLPNHEAKEPLHTRAKWARLEADANVPAKEQTQQCPSCGKYFVNLDRHKKCPKKASEATPVTRRKNKNKPEKRGLSDDEPCRSSEEHVTPTTVNDDTVGHNIRQRGTTRKTRLSQTVTEELE